MENASSPHTLVSATLKTSIAIASATSATAATRSPVVHVRTSAATRGGGVPWEERGAGGAEGLPTGRPPDPGGGGPRDETGRGEEALPRRDTLAGADAQVARAAERSVLPVHLDRERPDERRRKVGRTSSLDGAGADDVVTTRGERLVRGVEHERRRCALY